VFHVDFKEADGDAEHSLIRVLFDIAEYLLNGAWHNTILVLDIHFILIVAAANRASVLALIQITFTSKDCMSFARSCLSICHDHTVETIEHIVDNWCSDLRIRLILAGIHLEDTIKAKISLIETWPNQ